MDRKKLGMLLVFCVSLMWAIEPILARFSYVNADVYQTLGIRTIVIALVAAGYVFATKGSFKVSKLQFSWLAYMAVFATVVGEFIYLFALTRIPIINAVIIGHTVTIYIVIMTYLFLKEKLTKWDFLGIGFMILAALLVTSKTLSNLLSLRILTFWDFMVIIASVFWASTAIIVKRYLPKENAGTIVFYRYGVSAVILAAFLLYTKNLAVSNIYQVLLGLAIAAGIILYYEALKMIKAAQVSGFELMTPFFAAVLGFVFFRESLTIMQIFGIILLLPGIRLLARKES